MCNPLGTSASQLSKTPRKMSIWKCKYQKTLRKVSHISETTRLNRIPLRTSRSPDEKHQNYGGKHWFLIQNLNFTKFFLTFSIAGHGRPGWAEIWPTSRPPQCVDCPDCIQCMQSIQCTDYIQCTHCIQCIQCIQYVHCMQCIHCIDCIHCMQSIQCTDYIQCRHCIHCIQCLHCI